METTITSVEGVLELYGQQIPFYLEHQQVELGVAGVVDFYHMPASRLRGNDPDRSVSNFHSCLAHFWCILENSGYADDWDQQRDYLLARSYELVRRDKAVQQIYRDAF